MDCLTIKKHYYEDDQHHRVTFTLTNGTICSSLDVYLYSVDLRDLQNGLKEFYLNNNSEFIWQLGTEDTDITYQLYFRFFYFGKRGQIVIEVRMASHLPDPWGYTTRYYIGTELESINDFVKDMEKLFEDETVEITGIYLKFPES